ncbi:MAG TPA: iron ABC transporter permease [Phycisphaerae bacterium]
MHRAWRPYALWSLLVGVLALLLIWPIVSVVVAGFHDADGWTTLYLSHAFTSYRGALLNSLALALVSTAGCTVVAVSLAVLMNRYDFVGKRACAALLLVPLILPPFVGAIGLRKLLAPSGGPLVLVLQSLGVIRAGESVDLFAKSAFTATAALIILHLYPILFLNVQAALANIDPAMEEAARNLGAGRRRVLWRITLPLARPGIFAGGTIVFIWSFTELGTPLMVGYRNVAAVQVFDGLAEIATRPTPYALVAILMALSVAAYALGKLLLGGGGHAMMAKATVAARAQRLGLGRGLLVLLPFVLVSALAVLPHIGVILFSLAETWRRTVLPSEWTTRFFAQAVQARESRTSIVNSFKYASLATVLALLLGTLIAFNVVRSRIPAVMRNALDSLAMLPLTVPGLVMAFGYLAITRDFGFMAPLDPRKDPTLLLVIAYAVRRLPYVVRSAAAGLQQTSVTLEEAARNLGAGPFLTARRITLPLITANLVAGGLLAFSFAVLEVSDSLILAFRQADFPITKEIYVLGESLGYGNELACALGVMGMLLLAATIVIASVLLGKKLGAVFRV